MNESELTDLLERAGEQTPVGPPPLEALHAGARRRRRRRTAAVSSAAAAAVLIAAGGTALLVAPGTNPKIPAASTPPSALPAEMRLVGLGHVGVTVPKEWGTGQVRCMTPQQDTVLVGPRPAHFCATSRPAGVESVELGAGDPGPHYRFGFRPDVRFELDGVRAERQRTSCAAGGFGGGDVCSGMVYFPTLKIWFRAESSTNAGEVDRILERIRVVPDRVGVPEHEQLLPNGSDVTGQRYADLITSLGLRPVIITAKSPNYPAGELLRVSPVPGTMVTPGTKITLTVTARR
ncbi:PASTA domain-containing protein [Kribbella sp. CA-293567]|uniref:PASTA domain-containing protein n=1 Tax=Kribbella sp. CA-293567 TaxID=3002436 RepID=UPI0022DDF5D9|nr:PASTA domain-containing protein [Kribbella sp. CA-293567]WBQ03531.1 PASTA domain-containing protein [Kribbella sp. CA-293567]